MRAEEELMTWFAWQSGAEWYVKKAVVFTDWWSRRENPAGDGTVKYHPYGEVVDKKSGGLDLKNATGQ